MGLGGEGLEKWEKERGKGVLLTDDRDEHWIGWVDDEVLGRLLVILEYETFKERDSLEPFLTTQQNRQTRKLPPTIAWSPHDSSRTEIPLFGPLCLSTYLL